MGNTADQVLQGFHLLLLDHERGHFFLLLFHLDLGGDIHQVSEYRGFMTVFDNRFIRGEPTDCFIFLYPLEGIKSALFLMNGAAVIKICFYFDNRIGMNEKRRVDAAFDILARVPRDLVEFRISDKNPVFLHQIDSAKRMIDQGTVCFFRIIQLF